MKKFMFLGMAALGLAIYSCGGGSSKSAQNPNDAAAEFASPTGTLTSSNATKVTQGGVDAAGSSSLNSPSGIFGLSKAPRHGVSSTSALDANDLQACTTASGNTSTIDWGCVFDHDTSTECTGGGKTKTTTESGSDFYTIEYDGFSVDCSGNDTKFACDGQINISTDNVLLYCSDLTCTINDEELNFVGCGNADGDLLIHVGDDSYVVEDLTTDAGCTTVTGTIRDSVRSKTVTCDVATKDSDCSGNIDGVKTVSHCVIGH